MKFNEDGLIASLHQMSPTKALRLDEISPIFYKKKILDIMGKDISTIVLIALNICMFLAALNHIYITLIPNKKTP